MQDSKLYTVLFTKKLLCLMTTTPLSHNLQITILCEIKH